MEQFVSRDPLSYSLYFDLKIWFRVRNLSGTFEKRAPAGPINLAWWKNETSSLILGEETGQRRGIGIFQLIAKRRFIIGGRLQSV